MITYKQDRDLLRTFSSEYGMSMVMNEHVHSSRKYNRVFCWIKSYRNYFTCSWYCRRILFVSLTIIFIFYSCLPLILFKTRLNTLVHYHLEHVLIINKRQNWAAGQLNHLLFHTTVTMGAMISELNTDCLRLNYVVTIKRKKRGQHIWSVL